MNEVNQRYLGSVLELRVGFQIPKVRNCSGTGKEAAAVRGRCFTKSPYQAPRLAAMQETKSGGPGIHCAGEKCLQTAPAPTAVHRRGRAVSCS